MVCSLREERRPADNDARTGPLMTSAAVCIGCGGSTSAAGRSTPIAAHKTPREKRDVRLVPALLPIHQHAAMAACYLQQKTL